MKEKTEKNAQKVSRCRVLTLRLHPPSCLQSIHRGKGRHLFSMSTHRVADRQLLFSGEQTPMNFDDLPFVQELEKTHPGKHVKLAAVRVRSRGFVFGLQATYMVHAAETEHDGTLHTAPEHFSESGYYAYAYHHGGPVRDETFTCEPGEFIIGMKIRQGEIVDEICLLTSRDKCFQQGGTGGSAGLLLESERRAPVIAFCGQFKGVLSRVGVWIDSPWEQIGMHVVMRWLKENDRATPRDDTSLLLCRLDEGLFRYVLKFLLFKSFTLKKG